MIELSLCILVTVDIAVSGGTLMVHRLVFNVSMDVFYFV